MLSDENIFLLEEQLNLLNDKMHANNSGEASKKVILVQRANHSASVMVWLH